MEGGSRARGNIAGLKVNLSDVSHLTIESCTLKSIIELGNGNMLRQNLRAPEMAIGYNVHWKVYSEREFRNTWFPASKSLYVSFQLLDVKDQYLLIFAIVSIQCSVVLKYYQLRFSRDVRCGVP